MDSKLTKIQTTQVTNLSTMWPNLSSLVFAMLMGCLIPVMVSSDSHLPSNQAKQTFMAKMAFLLSLATGRRRLRDRWRLRDRRALLRDRRRPPWREPRLFAISSIFLIFSSISFSLALAAFIAAKFVSLSLIDCLCYFVSLRGAEATLLDS